MAKITLTAANNYARIALEPLNDKVHDASAAVDKMAHGLALKHTPPEVLTTFFKHKSYVKQRSNPSFCDETGSSNFSASFETNVPDNGKPIVLSPDEISELTKLRNVHARLKAKYKADFTTLESVIIGLSTAKRLKEAFPELYDKLNIIEGTTAVAVMNLDAVQAILREQTKL